jgi:hypothetical protein
MAGFWGSKVEGEEGDAPRAPGEQPKDEIAVVGTVCYTFPTEGKPPQQAQREYLERSDRLGYKIGLRLGVNQSVVYFAFRREGGGDVQMVEDAAVTQDLQTVFGSGPGEKWIGFVPTSKDRRRHAFPEPNVICYDMVLTLKPRVPLPLLIPIVMRFNNGQSFSASFIGSVVVIRARKGSG